MNKSMKTCRFVFQSKLLFLSICVLIVSACQSSAQADSTAPSQADGAETEQVQAQAIELEIGSGSFFLDDPRVGLAELSSYTATLTRTFEGSTIGEAQQWTETYVLMRDNESASSQLTFSTIGDLVTDPILVAEVGQIAYVKSGAEVCAADSVDPEIPSIERMDPSGLLSVLLGADEAGQEELDGVSANHYTFDQRALGKAGLEESTGELWVADDGGYIVKYSLTTTGGDTAFGEGIEGTLIWDYALSDINATVLPPLPEGCQLNAPLMADAANIIHTGYWLAFTTSATVADATAFYQAQLPGMGWTLSLGPATSEQSSFAEYTQGDQTIGVSISTGAEGTEVNVVLYYPEE